VLITSESGTGQGIGGARAPSGQSAKIFHPSGRQFTVGALTETLLESELFGHEKGAFTGAQYRKKGKFEIAEGGTGIFWMRSVNITLKTQTDLLRVLQEREITRVGGKSNYQSGFPLHRRY